MQTKSVSALLILLSFVVASCSSEKSAEEYLQSGQAFYDKQDWKSAVIEFKNAIKQDPENPQARALLGKTYLETFNVNAAVKELIRARDLGYGEEKIIVPLGKAYVLDRDFKTIVEEIKPSDDYSNALQANIYALRAISFLAIGNMDAAQKELELAKQKDDNATDVRLAAATFEKQNGDIEAQKRWLEPLLERDGGNADAWSEMGQIENAANKLEAAEKAYTRSIELRQFAHIDYARRALVRLGLGNYEGTKTDIDRLKKAAVNWPVVGHIEGLLALQNKNTDEARAHFQEVLSRAPEYAPSQYMLALIHFNNRSFQNALTLLEQYIERNPDQLRANLLYANNLLQLNQLDEALDVLNGLLERNPDEYSILSLLGNAYLRQGRSGEAIKVLQRAVALEPEQANSRLQLGAALLDDESTIGRGQQQLIKALELDPELQHAELVLFNSYLKERKFTEARQVARNLDKKNSDSSQGANLIALTYLVEEQKGKAEIQLRNALKRFPADFLTSHNLARIYIGDNSLAEARKLYEDVLTRDATNLKTLGQLALIAAREGDSEQMMLRLTQAMEGNPEQLSPKVALATQYLRQDNAREAVQILSDVKPEHEELPGYILVMSQAKIAVGEQQTAIRLLKSLIAENSNLPAAHLLLARAYSLDKNPNRMRESLHNVLDLAPDHLAGNIFMARLDLREGKFDAFKERVAYLETKYPDNPDVQFLKAKASSGGQDFKGAISTLSSLMDKVPHSDVVYDLARNQWQTGDREGAISSLELWVQDHADDNRALMLLAQYYLGNNQNNEARSTYEKLANQVQDDPVVLNNLAWLLKDSNPEQGVKYARQALELKADDAFIQDTLATLYLQTGDNARALEFSEKAANAMPQVGEIQFNYARVLAANDQQKKARDLLNSLLGKTKSESGKQQIRDELDRL